ncbi:MAG TPA: hypothetical protein VF100_07865, partial [Thermoanaerobaculia bacterium]
GETEEALRIWTDECLPLAVRAQDLDGIAHVRFVCARARLTRGDLEKGEAQLIYDELAESFRLNKKLQRVDGIAFSGSFLGQVLARAGHREEALSVLADSASAFEKMGREEEATQVRALREEIGKADQ